MKYCFDSLIIENLTKKYNKILVATIEYLPKNAEITHTIITDHTNSRNIAPDHSNLSLDPRNIRVDPGNIPVETKD